MGWMRRDGNTRDSVKGIVHEPLKCGSSETHAATLQHDITQGGGGII
ncbi:hypothetical protein DES53_101738 [Roseimicrobium gellanilyticum]|uniref:Uncharacterized protein n=1 Tax=Roseimicrobium gellanilyticum TaxID=748857 RepID=A0A366HX96_9BACT|nr:hypothetical protein DES53_101738 [Roseimicrobium gellanilyticum]